MSIHPRHLVSLRNEYSLVSYGPRCFAIVWGEKYGLLKLDTYIAAVNEYNPHRVLLKSRYLNLEYTSEPICIVEMKYKSSTHQTYFTYLMWQFSMHNQVFMHVWDTLEHDALRRDFLAPSYMDSELSINRLWLHNGTLLLVDIGHTEDNVHGEFVAEIGLQKAMDALKAGSFRLAPELTQELTTTFSDDSHLISLVTDLQHVYIPRNLAGLVYGNPHWIQHPDFSEFDPTKLDLNELPDSLLSDEVPFAVAVSDEASGVNENENPYTLSLNTAQWLSIAIKVNANRAFAEAKASPEELQHLNLFMHREAHETSFLSTYLMKNLHDMGYSVNDKHAKSIDHGDYQLKFEWKDPVCLLNTADKAKHEQYQRDFFDEEGDENDDFGSNLGKPSDSIPENTSSIFTGLEDTDEFSKYISKKGFFEKLSAALEKPELLEQAHALTEEEVKTTDDLEDFDDFVEYYAKHFLGLDDEDLKLHRLQGNSKPGEYLETSGSFDWEAYNDDSEYQSSEDSGG